jgi:hypothetical protein
MRILAYPDNQRVLRRFVLQVRSLVENEAHWCPIPLDPQSQEFKLSLSRNVRLKTLLRSWRTHTIYFTLGQVQFARDGWKLRTFGISFFEDCLHELFNSSPKKKGAK